MSEPKLCIVQQCATLAVEGLKLCHGHLKAAQKKWIKSEDHKAAWLALSSEEKAKSYLASQGFPLEFKVARSFKNAGFGVWQNEWISPNRPRDWAFLNPSTPNGFPIETDVIAQTDHITYVVECKHSGEHPWLVFSVDDPIPPGQWKGAIAGTQLAKAVLWVGGITSGEGGVMDFANTCQASGGVTTAPVHPDTKRLINPGEGRQKKDRQLYNAIQQCLLSVEVLRRNWEDYEDGAFHLNDGCPSVARIFVPLVVVEGDLLEARFDIPSQSFVYNDIRHAKLMWGAFGSGGPTMVEIVTARHLAEFSAVRYADAKEMIDRQLAAGVAAIQNVHARRESLYATSEARGGPERFLPMPQIIQRLRTRK